MTDTPYLAEHWFGEIRLESCRRTDGTFLLRRAGKTPHTVGQWRGPYATLEDALADHAARSAPPCLTRADLARMKRHGYYGVVDGVPMIMSRCRWNGGSILTAFELTGPEGAA